MRRDLVRAAFPNRVDLHRLVPGLELGDRLDHRQPDEVLFALLRDMTAAIETIRVLEKPVQESKVGVALLTCAFVLFEGAQQDLLDKRILLALKAKANEISDAASGQLELRRHNEDLGEFSSKLVFPCGGF